MEVAKVEASTSLSGLEFIGTNNITRLFVIDCTKPIFNKIYPDLLNTLVRFVDKEAVMNLTDTEKEAFASQVAERSHRIAQLLHRVLGSFSLSSRGILVKAHHYYLMTTTYKLHLLILSRRIWMSIGSCL